VNKRQDLEIANTDKSHKYSLEIENGELQLIEKEPDAFAKVCGSNSTKFLQMTVHWLSAVLPTSLKKNEEQLQSAMLMLEAIAPRNEMESMLAGQMIATHFCSLEMARRTQREGQFINELSLNGNLTNKFMRTFCTQMETLNKLRNGGKQKLTK